MSCVNCSHNNICIDNIDESMVKPLVYIYGMDENGCDAIYQPYRMDYCVSVSQLPTGVDLHSGDIILGADCKKHKINFTDVVVDDTPSLDLSKTGQVITGNVKESWVKSLLSTLPSSCVTFDYTNGVFKVIIDHQCVVSNGLCSVINTWPLDTTTAQTTVEFLGKDCKTHKISIAEYGAEETNTVGMVRTLSEPYIFTSWLKATDATADVIKEAVCNLNKQTHNGNSFIALTCDKGWVTYTNPSLSVLPSSSVLLETSGDLNHTLKASVIKSPDSGNALEIRSNGVFVQSPSAPITPYITSIEDSATVDLDVDSLSKLTANVKLSTSFAGNRITIKPDGLHVSAQSIGANGTLINLSGSNSMEICDPLKNIGQGFATSFLGFSNTNSCVRHSAIINPSTCNDISYDNQGFYSPRRSSFSIDTGNVTFAARYGLGVNNSQIYFGRDNTIASSANTVLPLTLEILNGCTEADVTLIFEMGHFSWMASGNDWQFRPYVSYRINSGAWTTLSPHFIHESGFSSSSIDHVIRFTSNGTASDVFHLSPNDTIMFSAYTELNYAVAPGGGPLFQPSIYNAQGASMKMTAMLLAN